MAIRHFRKMDIEKAREAATVTTLVIEGRKVVDITLTDALHMTAAMYGVATRDVNNANRTNGCGARQVYAAQSQFDEAEFEVAGKEGELAASIYLTGDGSAAIRQWIIATSDSGDILILVDGEKKIIDVKIRTRPYHRCFILTLKQWRSHSPDYYVATQYPSVERGHVRIWGHIERKRIDALIVEETERLLGEPLKWDYEGSGAEKHVKFTDTDLNGLIAGLKKSPKLDRLRESEVALGGIGDLGYGPVIAIPFTELDQIGELKNNIQ